MGGDRDRSSHGRKRQNDGDDGRSIVSNSYSCAHVAVATENGDIQLSNGLRVYFEEDHRLPLVAVTMAFSAGAWS